MLYRVIITTEKPLVPFFNLGKITEWFEKANMESCLTLNVNQLEKSSLTIAIVKAAVLHWLYCFVPCKRTRERYMLVIKSLDDKWFNN